MTNALGFLINVKGVIDSIDDVPTDTSKLCSGDIYQVKNQHFGMVWTGDKFVQYSLKEYQGDCDVAMFVHDYIEKSEAASFSVRNAYCKYNQLVHEKPYEFIPEELFGTTLQRQMAIQHGVTVWHTRTSPFGYIEDTYAGFTLKN